MGKYIHTNVWETYAPPETIHDLKLLFKTDIDCLKHSQLVLFDQIWLKQTIILHKINKEQHW